MVFGTDLAKDFNNTIMSDEFGRIVRFRYFTSSISGTTYDDDVTLAQSGTDVYVSGLTFPMRTRPGSNEAVLIEQGKLLTSDKILFVAGSVNVSGTFRVQLGSPTGENFSMLTPGVTSPDINDIQIYNKIYLRRLTTGSLSGE